MEKDLTFYTLREANGFRCTEFGHGVQEWSETDWACAVAGECGELCNLIKKRRRGDEQGPRALEMCGDEMADVIIYLDLLANKMGIDLAEAVRRKFNAVSEKRGLVPRL